MTRMYPQFVRPVTTIPALHESTNNFSRYFQGAYGCLDGSHFPIEVRKKDQENWRNRKGFISTNALLITDIGRLLFQYAMFGAEGVGGDSVALRFALANDLQFLPNGYLVGDAGYPLSNRILTPYRGVRYHLKEYGDTPATRPQNRYELFNLYHAKLRNQVERAIGVLKKRFGILRKPLVMSELEDMWSTLYSCLAIHYFIRIEASELDFDLEVNVNEADNGGVGLNVQEVDDHESTAWRDQIADEMWNN